MHSKKWYGCQNISHPKRKRDKKQLFRMILQRQMYRSKEH